MFFLNKEETVAYCDDSGDCDGCGNVERFVIPKEQQPEGFTDQFCSYCGKKTKIVKSREGVEITCPNGHDIIDRKHQYCISCGEKLSIETKTSITPVKE